MVEGDNGLGLDSFLEGTSSGETSEETPAETPAETPVESAKEEVSPAGESEEIVKTEGSSETPEKQEVKKEEKKEEKVEAPKIDWEADDNPFKKRYRDTQTWANKLNQEKLQIQQQQTAMQKQLEILNKKLDGTYDETRDGQTGPSPDEIANASVTVGKTVASRQAAYQALGQDKVDADLAEFHETFNANQLVQARVLQSDSPILEALQVLKEHKFITKYGRDPEVIISKLREEFLAAERPVIEKQLREELLKKIDKKQAVAPTLSSVRGSGNTKTEIRKGSVDGPNSLKGIFGR